MTSPCDPESMRQVAVTCLPKTPQQVIGALATEGSRERDITGGFDVLRRFLFFFLFFLERDEDDIETETGSL